MASDVEITIINDTSQDVGVVIFDQDPNLDVLFIELFPTAWGVYKLPGKAPAAEAGSRVTVVLPLQSGIAGGPPHSTASRKVSVSEPAGPAQKWTLVKDEEGQYKLRFLGQAKDDSIICRNDTGSYAAISLVKDGRPFLTYPDVPTKSAATFLVRPYVYLAWCRGIVEGDLVRAAISAPQAVAVAVAGFTTVEAVLQEDPETGELRWSVQTNKGGEA